MKLKIGIVALAVAAVSAMACADITPIGDPIEGGSWSQRFLTDAGNYGINMIAIKMHTADEAFDATGGPAIWSFDLGGWEVVYQDDEDYPTLVIAKGPATPIGHRLHFNVRFDGPNTPNNDGPFTFSAVAFADDERIEGNDLHWGPGWSAPDLTWDVQRDELELLLIPLPPPVWLAAAGLSGVVIWRRRKTA